MQQNAECQIFRLKPSNECVSTSKHSESRPRMRSPFSCVRISRTGHHCAFIWDLSNFRNRQNCFFGCAAQAGSSTVQNKHKRVYPEVLLKPFIWPVFSHPFRIFMPRDSDELFSWNLMISIHTNQSIEMISNTIPIQIYSSHSKKAFLVIITNFNHGNYTNLQQNIKRAEMGNIY